MNMTKKELKDTKLILNIIIAIAGLLLLASIFSTLFSAQGIIYYMTNEAGEEVGAVYQEVFKVYNFILPIETQETRSNYFRWEMSTLYILLFLTFIMNFINLGENNKLKQYIVSGALLLLSAILIFIIIFYKKELELIFDEFVSQYFRTSYINTKNGTLPFLAYAFGILAGLISLYKAWIVGRLQQLEYKNRRYKS